MIATRRPIVFGMLALLVLTTACNGESDHAASTQPDNVVPSTATPPADPLSAGPARHAPASVSASTDTTAAAWVRRIADRHADVQSVHARLIYDRIQDLLGAEERRFGILVYDAGPPGRFAVHVDRLLIDDRLENQDRWYVFDGRWLVERLTDRRQFMARQVVAPDADPTMQDPLALGRGPFVVPIGPNGQRLLERFDVEIIEDPPAEPDAMDQTSTGNADDASPATDSSELLHLRLSPREHDRTDFETIDIWYDRQTLLPQRVRSMDSSDNVSDIFLRDLKIDQPVDTMLFDTAPPDERGWEIEITPWEPREAATAQD